MNGLKRQINTVYYDIHAHSAQTSVAEDVVACYNVIVGKGTLSDVSSGQPVSCGIHPWYIREEAVVEQLARFRELALNEQVIMIGEAGLDKQISIPLDSLFVSDGVFDRSPKHNSGILNGMVPVYVQVSCDLDF